MEEDSILDGFKSLQEAVTLGFASLDGKLAVTHRLKDAVRGMLGRLDVFDARARALESRASALEARVEAFERLSLALPRPFDAREAIARIERHLSDTAAGDAERPEPG